MKKRKINARLEAQSRPFQHYIVLLFTRWTIKCPRKHTLRPSSCKPERADNARKLEKKVGRRSF